MSIKNNKKVVTESNLQSRESQFSGFAIRYKINSELRQGDLKWSLTKSRYVIFLVHNCRKKCHFQEKGSLDYAKNREKTDLVGGVNRRQTSERLYCLYHKTWSI